MPRGRLLAIALLLLTGLTAVPASAAVGPDCQVRYSVDDVLTLRDTKPFDIPLDCGWSAEGFSLVVSDPAQHGTVSPAGWDEELHEHLVTYAPAAGYVGNDEFTLSVSDGTEQADVVVGVVLVPNTRPGCDRSDEHRYGHAAVDEPYTWTVPCWDLDLQDMFLDPTLVTPPQHGSVDVQAVLEMTSDTTLTATYTPKPGFVGQDQFTAGVNDGDHQATVTFDVIVDDGKRPVLDLSVARQTPRQVARRGLHLYSATDEAVISRIQVSVQGRTAKRLGLVRRADGPVLIGSMRDSYDSDVAALIRLALRPRAASALRPARRVPITVRFRGVDPLGNVAQVTRRVTLRR